MKNKPSVEPTAEIIDNMAITFFDYSEELKRISKKMRERNDLSYSQEAINSISNCILNLRMDLLVARPLREYERILNTIKESCNE